MVSSMPPDPLAFGHGGGTHLDGYDLASIAALADANRNPDPYGYRKELVELVRVADALQTKTAAQE